MFRTRTAFAAIPIALAMAVATCAVGHASPDVVGKTFDEANSTLRSWGYTAQVVNTFGARVDRGNCIVTQQHDRQSSNGREALLALNCNAPVAAPGVPGNSAASPAGRTAAAAAVPRVLKARIEESLVSQLATSPGPAWAQCSGDLIGTVDSSIDCTALANQEKHSYRLTVTDTEDGRISYNISPLT
ncbi:PASTA domain-containing protein [Mycolicibacterium helvum]|uniref:PASTA domain-containing protein n=1 Tax=Mycolicibacterium helvum TaxID=1534349 RepID=A0A7I7T7C8_9MYCO|nr:hypothetical protein [Mycolicibacterium helvum]BBY64988.1 hypothetical protein MHEL_32310 [Mycolicibacterium helvum]